MYHSKWLENVLRNASKMVFQCLRNIFHYGVSLKVDGECLRIVFQHGLSFQHGVLLQVAGEWLGNAFQHDVSL